MFIQVLKNLYSKLQKMFEWEESNYYEAFMNSDKAMKDHIQYVKRQRELEKIKLPPL